MGITSFWDTLDDDGERINLFQIASDHIQQNGRPYRIAVDTPYWLFKNLDEESVQAIRELSHRASNPNEKAILYRLMRFACHGIQVCLVFDGPGRPIKRGKQLTTTSHTLIGQRLLLLKEAAQKLGVLCWEAPAEAEAECANMLRLGVVDAVWSEDSDIFLFRGEALLRFHYEKPGQKDNVMARLYRMSAIKEKFRMMDWRGAILFAILVGGDYAVKGLPGCGPKIALGAISKGLGAVLIDAFKRDNLQMWRQKFQKFLTENRSKISLPSDFPNIEVLKNYIQPQVSSEEMLQSGILWELAIDQPSLKVLITTRFNFSVQEYIRWVVRMLLSRRLLTGPGDTEELELQFTRDVSTKESGNIDLSRVSFLVGSIVPSRTFLETWPVKDTIALDRIKAYVHEDRIECDIPDSIIRMAVPALLKDKKVREPKTPKVDQQGGKKPKVGRPQKDEVRPQALNGNQDSGQGSLKRKRGRPRKSEAGAPVVPIGSPRQTASRAIRGAGGGLGASRGVHERDPTEDDSDDTLPDLADLGRKKMTTSSVKVNKTSGQAESGSANDAVPPGPSYTVQRGESILQR